MRTSAPFWWALFSAGGMLSAIFFPVLIVITGILIPFGLVADTALAYDRVHGVLSHWLVRLFLFALIALPLFHWAHRFLYTLAELGLRRSKGRLAVLCYGGAIVGTIVAAVVLLRV